MLDLPVLFPFGHGLSYTAFSLSNLNVKTDPKTLVVEVQVSNTGAMTGAEVVQVYVRQNNPSIKRPKKELKGFTKVLLNDGESKTVKVEIDIKYAGSFWDEIRNAWILEKDGYEVIVGNSSADEGALKGGFEIEKTSWWNGI